MQSVELARLLSHIPPPRIGIERRRVKKFTRPIRLLLDLMAFFLSFESCVALFFLCTSVFVGDAIAVMWKCELHQCTCSCFLIMTRVK